MKKKAMFIPVALVALTALAIAAIGGTATAASNPATASAAGAKVKLGNASGVGKILVSGNGMTLYLFQKDTKGSGKSTCGSSCAKFWPPLLTKGKPVAMGGVKSSLLGTIKRADGTTQVTYNGWPLYGFVEDKKPGEATGTGSTAFGGGWYPMHANGSKAS